MKKTLALLSLLILVGCGSGDVGSSSGPTGGSSASNNPPTNNSNVSARLVPPAPPGDPRTVAPRVLPRVEETQIRPLGTPLVVNLRQGWNLFAMPFSPPTTLTVSQPSNILGFTRYQASTGQYVDLDFAASTFTTANPFSGYWLYCSSPTTVTMDGVDQHEVTLSTALVVGWNLVGTPLSTDVPTADVSYGPDTMVQAFATFRLWPGVLGFDGSNYVETGHPPTLLRAAQSQWIYAYQADTLTRLGDPVGAKQESP